MAKRRNARRSHARPSPPRSPVQARAAIRRRGTSDRAEAVRAVVSADPENRAVIRSAALQVYKDCDALEEHVLKQRDDVACEQGCSHCCYIYLDASYVEALVAVDYLLEHKSGVYIERVRRRATEMAKALLSGSITSPADYHARNMPCMFLDADNRCGVYPVRPLMCRNYYVVSDPELCKGPDVKMVQRVDTSKVTDNGVAYFHHVETHVGLADAGRTAEQTRGPFAVLVFEALHNARQGGTGRSGVDNCLTER